MPYKNPEDQRKYWNKWYQKNKTKFKKQVVELKKKHRQNVSSWIQEYKQHCSCLFCGETEPVCLDFHHLSGTEKEFNISWNNQHVNILDVLKELEKCVVLCSNCHRKIHKYKNDDIPNMGL
jgi:hypothetical protein